MKYTKMYEAIAKILKNEEQISFVMSDIMARRIELWSALFQNKEPWLSDTVRSLNLPATVSGEIARLVTLEMETKVEGSSRASYIDDIYRKTVAKLRIYVEYACAKGGLIIKPYVADVGICTQFVQADSFFPISFDDAGNITRCVFLDQFREGNTIFTRVEYHKMEGGFLTIRNRVFKAMTEGVLGVEIPIDNVPRWETLADRMVFENVQKLPFGYLKIPMANQEDNNSPLGVSCYSRAVDLIKGADERYSQIDWEYGSKETAVHIAESLLKKNPQTQAFEYPGGRERLYREVDYNTGAVDKPLLDVFSPDIRDQSLFNGLNQQLRRVEFACNLAYGTLSDPNNTDKTAEEIRASKQRSYSFVESCQRALQNALDEYVAAIDFWATIYNLAPSGSYHVSYKWDDSLVVDTEKERQTDRADVAMGAMQLWEYRAKHYDEDEETARRMVTQQADLIEE